MQKECAICGIIFDTENKNRKYCDDCSAHTRSRREEYSRAMQGHIGEHMSLNYIAEYVPNVRRYSRFQLIFSTSRR